jgi:hypothetical protein
MYIAQVSRHTQPPPLMKRQAGGHDAHLIEMGFPQCKPGRTRGTYESYAGAMNLKDSYGTWQIHYPCICFVVDHPRP